MGKFQAFCYKLCDFHVYSKKSLFIDFFTFSLFVAVPGQLGDCRTLPCGSNRTWWVPNESYDSQLSPGKKRLKIHPEMVSILKIKGTKTKTLFLRRLITDLVSCRMSLFHPEFFLLVNVLWNTGWILMWVKMVIQTVQSSALQPTFFQHIFAMVSLSLSPLSHTRRKKRNIMEILLR